MLKISAFLFNTSVDSHESPTTFSCCNIVSHQYMVYERKVVYVYLLS